MTSSVDDPYTSLLDKNCVATELLSHSGHFTIVTSTVATLTYADDLFNYRRDLSADLASLSYGLL
jgi:copper oxidase (laccase) domain-containing protein